MSRSFWDSKWRGVKFNLPATAFARKSFKYMEGGRLLDLGCGDGKDSVYFAKKAWMFLLLIYLAGRWHF